MLIWIITLFIILYIIAQIYTIKESYQNHRASLDIYYKTDFTKKPDRCGECDGLCTYCNVGKDVPNVCSEEMKEECRLPPEILAARYVYIISNAFNKSVTFMTSGNDSHVYLDPILPDGEGKIYPLHTGREDKPRTLPQKWQLIRVGECKFMIRSYSGGKGVDYYLVGTKDGKVKVSLFGGSDDQIWNITEYRVGGHPVQTIKSAKYCTFLGGTDRGFLKKDSGMTYLDDQVSMSELWKISAT